MYETLTSWENLRSAHKKASKGKRSHPNVAEFEYRLEENLIGLQAELQDFSYRPGPYTSFYIHEPKKRLISAAPVRDRVVHHALCNLIEPIFERSFVSESFANRVGKGTHRALTHCQKLTRRYAYVLQCDVQQFFPAIDHMILRQILFKKVDDPAVRWLIDQILASGEGVLGEVYRMRWFGGDDLFAASRPRGLPIGNLTSQFWANCFMSPFDHFIKRELGCAGYARYVDDMLLFSNDPKQLCRWRQAIIDRLATMRLTIHPGSHPRPTAEGVPFLGFVTFPDKRRLKRRKGIHFQRQLKRKVAAYQTGEMPLDTITDSVKGWANHVRYGNTVGLRKAVLSKVPIPAKQS